MTQEELEKEVDALCGEYQAPYFFFIEGDGSICVDGYFASLEQLKAFVAILEKA